MKVEIGPYPDEGEQSIDVRIDEYDTWSMDYTLSNIISPMLKQLKVAKQGAPLVDNEDVPERLRMPDGWYEEKYGRNGETDPHFFDRWNWVMGEMIFAFDSLLNDDWEQNFWSEADTSYQRTEVEFKGVGPAQLRLFPDEDGSTEDYELYEWVSGRSKSHFDSEGYKKYNDRMQNGFRLFGKYYRSLWD